MVNLPIHDIGSDSASSIFTFSIEKIAKIAEGERGSVRILWNLPAEFTLLGEGVVLRLSRPDRMPTGGHTFVVEEVYVNNEKIRSWETVGHAIAEFDKSVQGNGIFIIPDIVVNR